MTTRGRAADPGEHLSLAGLVEAMTSEFEATGLIDAARWARRYVEWQMVVHELSPLLRELGELGMSSCSMPPGRQTSECP